MFNTQLSTRRELVEQLDSEPLFDYLVQNGVLDETGVEFIRNEKSEAKTNLALLKHLEVQRPGSVNLFINALRQTGQHQLANILDNGKRINPAPGSGYLSNNRHKGQVSLVILVKALKLPPETNRNLVQTHNREWVSLDDVKLYMDKVSQLAEPGTSHNLDVEDLPEEDEKPNTRSCFCVCFRKLFHRSKGQNKKNTVESVQNNLNVKSDKQNNKNANQHIKYMSADNVNINGTQKDSPTRLKYGKQRNRFSVDLLGSDSLVSKSRDARLSLENIRNNAEIFRIKSEDFYRYISDRESTNSVKLLKYFEQDRGLLVLETNCSNGLVVVNICMQIGQLQQLQRDIHNGKLNKDLENILITEEVLAKIGARGVKLTTEIDREEFDLAEQELS